MAAMLGGERDHRGGAAKRRRHRCAVEIIGADHTGRRALLDMAMAVDAARQYPSPARIDLPRRRAETLAEGRGAPPLDPDIATDNIGRGRHGAIADHQIVLAHALSSMPDNNASST